MKIPAIRMLTALVVAAAATTGCADAPTAGPERPSLATAAPLLAAAPGKGIPDHYIVVFHDGAPDAPGAGGAADGGPRWQAPPHPGNPNR